MWEIKQWQTWLNSMIYHGINIIIKKYCLKKIKYMSSVTDKKSCDFLFKDLNTKIFKISSGEITNLNFLKYCAKKKCQLF